MIPTLADAAAATPAPASGHAHTIYTSLADFSQVDVIDYERCVPPPISSILARTCTAAPTLTRRPPATLSTSPTEVSRALAPPFHPLLHPIPRAAHARARVCLCTYERTD